MDCLTLVLGYLVVPKIPVCERHSVVISLAFTSVCFYFPVTSKKLLVLFRVFPMFTSDHKNLTVVHRFA